MPKFKLVTATDPAALTDMVNEHINLGWSPYQGLSVFGVLGQLMEYQPELSVACKMKLLYSYNLYILADSIEQHAAQGWDLYEGVVTGEHDVYQWLVSVDDGTHSKGESEAALTLLAGLTVVESVVPVRANALTDAQALAELAYTYEHIQRGKAGLVVGVDDVLFFGAIS